MGVLFEIFPNRSAITTSTRDAGSSRIASLLGEDEPLARRLEQTGARIASGTWPSAEKGRARIEHAVAATLAGMRDWVSRRALRQFPGCFVTTPENRQRELAELIGAQPSERQWHQIAMLEAIPQPGNNPRS